MSSSNQLKPAPGNHFIQNIIDEDRRAHQDCQIVTRFPPEPNGYLHIGHAKSICLNFGLAKQYSGTCHLRFDDTNPAKEDLEYVESIQNDIQWLGFDWREHLYHASDYFEQLYRWGQNLIKAGHAYVCSLNEEEIRTFRGTVTAPGTPSPDRTRSVDENLKLFEKMRTGEFAEGAYTLRAKIDMAASNMKMRDPLLYRIRHVAHDRTGTDWSIYPMYDYAHCLSDAIEGITHSICTLEFENNRELYDWIIAHVDTPAVPKQIEFARLNLTYTVMSKRKLLQLVETHVVSGWDDPRMPTIAGLRRRGYTAEAIRSFCDAIGVAKANSTVDITLLEHSIRQDLNQKAPRVMAVLQPLRVVIENYPEDLSEDIVAPYFPHDVPKEGNRTVPFSRVLYIEKTDFLEEPPKDFFRLAPGKEVRLRYGYIIKCLAVIKDETTGQILELRCTYDPNTRGGQTPDGRKIKGTIHWVSAAHAAKIEVRLYDRLFMHEKPDAHPDGIPFNHLLNPKSCECLNHALIEPSVAQNPTHSMYQFERNGYFCRDAVDSTENALVFNRTVGLRDSWNQSIKAKAPSQPIATQATTPRTPNPTKRKRKRSSKTLQREQARATNPILQKKFEHYRDQLHLTESDANVLSSDEALATFFERAVATHPSPRPIAKWVVNEVLAELKEMTIDSLPFEGDAIGHLIALVEQEIISGKMAKTVFATMLNTGTNPRSIVEKQGLKQITNQEELTPIIDQVLNNQAEAVTAYAEGQTSRLGFLVGQVMLATNGRASPKIVNQLLRERLS